MKNSILNYDYVMNYITTNEGEEVPYRWSHGAADMHPVSYTHLRAHET